MFPKPKTIIQRAIHTECRELIEKGVHEPYTLDNLFESPPEHTYQGWGKKFEEFCADLNKQNKEIGLFSFQYFLMKQNLQKLFLFIGGATVDYCFPMLMEVFLDWMQEDKFNWKDGFTLVVLAFIMSVLRLAGIQGANYINEVMSVETKNAVEVSFKLFKFYTLSLDFS